MAGSRPKQDMPNIEQLKGEENYMMWSSLMQDHLAACDMWAIVEGTEEPPDDPDPLPDNPTEAQRRSVREKVASKKDYRLRAASAKNIINQMIDPKHRQLIITTEILTAKQAWDKLKEQFQKDTAVNRIQLMQKLFRLEQANQDVSVYFAEYHNLVGRLAKLNFALPDDAGPAILLNGLSDKFQTVGMIYGAKENLSVSMLEEALSQYEKNQERNSTDEGNSSSSLLLAGSGSSQSNGGQKPQTWGPCFGCGEMGHRRFNCPKNGTTDRGNGYSKNGGSNRGNGGRGGRGPTRGRGRGFWRGSNFQHRYSQQQETGNGSSLNGEEDQNQESSNWWQNEMGTKNGHYKDQFHPGDNYDLMMASEHALNSLKAPITELDSIKDLKKYNMILDSGCTSHMVKDRELLQKYESLAEPQRIILGDNHECIAVGKGCVEFYCITGKQLNRYVLPNVLYVPTINCNVLSVAEITKKQNRRAVLSNTDFSIVDQAGTVVLQGYAKGNMYFLSCYVNPSHRANICSTSPENSCLSTWHLRLGHCGQGRLQDAVSSGKITGVNGSVSGSLGFCEACIQGKQQAKPYPKSATVRAQEPLKLIHSDVCGPMSTQSPNGKRYFITFTDDYSRMVWVMFMHRKDEAFNKFREFEKSVSKRTSTGIKTLRTDNGGEYVSKEFESYLAEHGIHHQKSVPGCPQQNGVAERMNRTLMEMARCQLSWASQAPWLWAEAVNAAAYIRNRLPCATIGVTPYEMWYGRPPNVAHLKVWGCIAYSKNNTTDKLASRCDSTRFVGYEDGVKGYRLWDEGCRKIIIRRNVEFNEKKFTLEKEEETDDLPTSSESAGGRWKSDRETKGKPPVRFPNEDTTKCSSLENDIANSYPLDTWTEQCGVSDNSALHVLFHANTSTTEPLTLNEAMTSPEAVQWKKATDAEYNSLVEMDTWNLCELPAGRKAIGCKWTFKLKYDEFGQIQRYKARLVAKGFSQRYGVDYVETFAPVVRLETLRAMLARAVEEKYEVHQMDVTTAFLNGELKETIYMQQPAGYTKEGKEHLVCELKRSLYGLKQSPRCWHIKFHEHLMSLGFTRCKSDPCLYIKHDPFVMLTIYVDDLVLFTKNEKVMNDVKQSLKWKLKMTDAGRLHYLLGIKVMYEHGAIMLTQNKYIEKLIDRYGMKNARTSEVPVSPGLRLTKEGQDELVDVTEYQSIVGSLMYVALATRPDIQFAVSYAARFNQQPRMSHLNAAKQIIRYLKTTSEYCLRYANGKGELVGYADADLAGNLDDSKSTTGYVFLMGGGAVSWHSSKQKTVSTSTSNAEYLAMGAAAREAIFLRQLLIESGSSIGRVEIYEDNQPAMAMAKNPVFHSRQKHIRIQYHLVRDEIEQGTIDVKYCPSKDMIADILTKPLSRASFGGLRKALGISDA